MGAMKLQHDDIETIRAERDNYMTISEYYRTGLCEIVRMEKFPTESGSHIYDGIYPTGAFASKVLKGEWKK